MGEQGLEEGWLLIWVLVAEALRIALELCARLGAGVLSAWDIGEQLRRQPTLRAWKQRSPLR